MNLNLTLEVISALLSYISLNVLIKHIEDVSWLRGNMTFIFECYSRCIIMFGYQASTVCEVALLTRGNKSCIPNLP